MKCTGCFLLRFMKQKQSVSLRQENGGRSLKQGIYVELWLTSGKIRSVILKQSETFQTEQENLCKSQVTWLRLFLSKEISRHRFAYWTVKGTLTSIPANDFYLIRKQGNVLVNNSMLIRTILSIVSPEMTIAVHWQIKNKEYR